MILTPEQLFFADVIGHGLEPLVCPGKQILFGCGIRNRYDNTLVLIERYKDSSAGSRSVGLLTLSAETTWLSASVALKTATTDLPFEAGHHYRVLAELVDEDDPHTTWADAAAALTSRPMNHIPTLRSLIADPHVQTIPAWWFRRYKSLVNLNTVLAELCMVTFPAFLEWFTTQTNVVRAGDIKLLLHSWIYRDYTFRRWHEQIISPVLTW